MRRITVALFALMMIAGAVAAHAFDGAEKKAVTNKLCPVSGGPVVEKYRTEYKGQFVYLCCEGCVNEFNKNAEAIVAKMSKEEQEPSRSTQLARFPASRLIKRSSSSLKVARSISAAIIASKNTRRIIPERSNPVTLRALVLVRVSAKNLIFILRAADEARADFGVARQRSPLALWRNKL